MTRFGQCPNLATIQKGKPIWILYEQLSGKAVREENWNRITYLFHVRSFTASTALSKVAQVLNTLHSQKSLDLLDNGPAYRDISNDPFRAFQLKSLLEGDILEDPLLESLKVAATRSYMGKLDVLNSLRDPVPVDAFAFNKLRNFKPYQDYIADYERATELYEEIKRNPTAYKTFTSNWRQMKFLRFAAYSHLIPVE
jgi:hypothetical protein